MADFRDYGLFIQTTSIFDVTRVYETDVNSPEFKELLIRLYNDVNSMCLALNLKDTGYYTREEFVNGQSFFPNPVPVDPTIPNNIYRQVHRLTIDFGALPNTGTKSVPHGLAITPTWSFTRIYGAASNTTGLTYIPLPFASATGSPVELNVDAVNVNVITTSNLSAYNKTYIILEYIKT